MEKTNNYKLFKIGERITFGECGIDYDLEPGKLYNVKLDMRTDDLVLNVGHKINMPEKLYTPKADERFIDKVLTQYKNLNRITGVLLSGKKGTGKTVMAKQIAIRSGLPILNLDSSLHPADLKKLINKLENTPMCILFDEFDKVGERYDTNKVLSILDGTDSAGKHLVIFTCNDMKNVNEYMLDRCGRIRYWKNFEEMSTILITEILNDRLNDKSETPMLTDFIIENFNIKSFDNISAFVDEVNAFPNYSFEELFDDMNLSSK